MPQAKLRKLLLRTGLHFRKIQYKTPGGSSIFRTYWPAHLHPAARALSTPQPDPQQNTEKEKQK